MVHQVSGPIAAPPECSDLISTGKSVTGVRGNMTVKISDRSIGYGTSKRNMKLGHAQNEAAVTKHSFFVRRASILNQSAQASSVRGAQSGNHFSTEHRVIMVRT